MSTISVPYRTRSGPGGTIHEKEKVLWIKRSCTAACYPNASWYHEYGGCALFEEAIQEKARRKTEDVQGKMYVWMLTLRPRSLHKVNSFFYDKITLKQMFTSRAVYLS